MKGLETATLAFFRATRLIYVAGCFHLAAFYRSSRGRSHSCQSSDRRGVPVGFEIAKTLALRFDVYVVRKLGVPGHEELAMGAIASGGVRVLNSKVLNRLSNAEKAVRKATAKLTRRERQYREGREFRPIEGNTVILVDDGLATGATMRAWHQAHPHGYGHRPRANKVIGARTRTLTIRQAWKANGQDRVGRTDHIKTVDGETWEAQAWRFRQSLNLNTHG